MAEQRVRRLPPKVLCPRCGEVADWVGNPHRPFCSERCRLIDLGAWASGDYKIPGKSEAPEQAQQNAEPGEKEKG